MELAEAQIEAVVGHDVPWHPINIYPFGDLHLGGGGYEKLFRQELEVMIADPNGYALGMGDYLDLMSPSNRREIRAAKLYDSTLNELHNIADRYVTHAKRLLRGSEGRWLGMLEGHHFLETADGLTTDMKIAEAMRAPFLGSCFVPGTRVLCRDLSWVPIGQVAIGDELWAPTEDAGRMGRTWQIATVTGRSVRTARIWQLTMADGTVFFTTAEHPFLRPTTGKKHSHWVTVSEMAGRPWGRKLVKVFDPWKKDPSREAGWLAGFFDGEGSVSKAAGSGRWIIQIAQSLGPTLEHAKASLAAKDFQFAARPMRHIAPHHKRREQLTLKGGLHESLRFLGTVRPERLVTRFDMQGARVRFKPNAQHVSVTRVSDTGAYAPVVNLQTSTGTFVAEGYPVHNCAIVRLSLASAPPSQQRHTYDIWCHHGAGGGQLTSAPLNRLERIMRAFHADLYLVGHAHKQVAARLQQVYMTRKRPYRLGHRDQIIACTGGYLRGYMLESRVGRVPRGTYVERGMMPPSALGGIKVSVTPTRLHELRAEVTL